MTPGAVGSSSPAPRPRRRDAGKAPAQGDGVPLAGKIELWPLGRLRPDSRNPRLHSPQQVRRIAFSILEFGFTNPILIAEGTIVAGHGRLAAARQLRLERVPVIRLDHLTEIQRRAYLLADNKLAEDAEWDPQLLAAELRALESEAYDLGAAGFSHAELEDLEHAIRKAADSPRTPAAAGGAGRILRMLEFDTQEQKAAWIAFEAWLRERNPKASLGAALAAHVSAAMGERRGR